MTLETRALHKAVDRHPSPPPSGQRHPNAASPKTLDKLSSRCLHQLPRMRRLWSAQTRQSPSKPHLVPLLPATHLIIGRDVLLHAAYCVSTPLGRTTSAIRHHGQLSFATLSSMLSEAKRRWQNGNLDQHLSSPLKLLHIKFQSPSVASRRCFVITVSSTEKLV